MNTVETVRGPVSVSNLGQTLPHEHIFVNHPELEQNWPINPEWLGEEEMARRAAAELNELYKLGIQTLVDLTVPGLGRNLPRIQAVAALTNVNIVVATGYYTSFGPLPAYFHTHGPGLAIDGPDPLPAFFIRDIVDGIADTGIKANMIKVATDAPGVTDEVARVLRAAAIAHRETGATITTHTHVKEFTGRDQQEFFRREGVPLEHVVIGHSGDTMDIDYLRELMDNGSTIGLDRFGMGTFLADFDLEEISDDQRIATTLKLIELGYADQLTLSQDAVVFAFATPPSYLNQVAPDWGLSHIWRRILPTMRELGVSDATIGQMTVTNPARLLIGAR